MTPFPFAFVSPLPLSLKANPEEVEKLEAVIETLKATR